jgi:GTP:adenosylcobinamide-phosphate guanylyltransferase
MDAVLTAGGIPGVDDPLYPYTQGGPKAMLEVAGKPLIQWVLDALSEAQKVENVVVIGLNEEHGLACEKPMIYVPNQVDMLHNIRVGTLKAQEINPNAEFVLSVSSDIPGITGEMIDWTIDSVLQTDHDLYYNVITREVMEARYPESNRSFIKLKDYEVCGGDMNAFRISIVTKNEEFLTRLIAARKSILKQAALVGYGTLILLLMRRLTIESGVERASKSLGIRGRAVICPYAEIGMDVDKPHQLEILRADLERAAAL